MKAHLSLPRSTRLMVLTTFVGSVFYFGPAAANFQLAEAGIAQKLLRAHNKERKKRNRPRLRRSGALNRAAKKYANVMAANNHFSHEGPAPGNSTAGERMAAEGFHKLPQGENIARGQRSVGEVMRGWMRSAGHRRNILGRGFKRAGFGKAAGPNGPYWVTDFGG